MGRVYIFGYAWEPKGGEVSYKGVDSEGNILSWSDPDLFFAHTGLSIGSLLEYKKGYLRDSLLVINIHDHFNYPFVIEKDTIRVLDKSEITFFKGMEEDIDDLFDV